MTEIARGRQKIFLLLPNVLGEFQEERDLLGMKETQHILCSLLPVASLSALLGCFSGAQFKEQGSSLSMTRLSDSGYSLLQGKNLERRKVSIWESCLSLPGFNPVSTMEPLASFALSPRLELKMGVESTKEALMERERDSRTIN